MQAPAQRASASLLPQPFHFFRLSKGWPMPILVVRVICTQSTNSDAKSVPEMPSPTQSEITFYQLSGYPAAQSSWHVTLTIAHVLGKQIIKDTHRLLLFFYLAPDNQQQVSYRVVKTAVKQTGFCVSNSPFPCYLANHSCHSLPLQMVTQIVLSQYEHVQ